MRIIMDSATKRIAIQCDDEHEYFSLTMDLAEIQAEWDSAAKEHEET